MRGLSASLATNPRKGGQPPPWWWQCPNGCNVPEEAASRHRGRSPRPTTPRQIQSEIPVSPRKGKKGRGQTRSPWPGPEPEASLNESAVMTLQEVAEYLGCSYAIVLLLVMKGGLPKFQLGGAGDGWRVRRSDLEKWIRDRPMM
jgi:excisionase family DNA binding protein